MNFLDKILESAGFGDKGDEIDLSVDLKDQDVYEEFDATSELKYDALGDAISQMLNEKKSRDTDMSAIRPPTRKDSTDVKRNKKQDTVKPQPTLLQIQKSKIVKSHPYKVLILNLSELVKKKDLVKALSASTDNHQFDIIGVEFFEELGNDKGYTAFVHLESKEDLDIALSNSLLTFGLYIGDRRSRIESVDNRRSLSIKTPSYMQKDDFLKLFSPWGLNLNTDITLLSMRDHPTDKTYGGTITFKSHDVAYSVWATINKLRIFDFEASWVQPIDSIFYVLSRTRDLLTEENLVLREKLEQMKKDHSFFEAKYRDVLCEHNVTQEPNATDELSFQRALYEHIKRVSEMTQGNIEEASILLDIGQKKLARTVKELKEVGYVIEFK